MMVLIAPSFWFLSHKLWLSQSFEDFTLNLSLKGNILVQVYWEEKWLNLSKGKKRKADLPSSLCSQPHKRCLS